jgi:phospholipid transport system substrate-binding protein
MTRMVRGAAALMIGLICLSGGPVRAAETPADVVRVLDAALLDIMKNADALGVKGRYQKLEPVVRRTFDVGYMTRLSVGRLWADLKPDERRRAMAAFERYITINYAVQLDGYSGEEFKVLGEQRIKHGMLVRTQLVKSDGEAVTINYMLHDNDKAWQIRDVYLEGTISQLATRRSEFTAILRNGGIEGLISTLNKKIADLGG